jgi:hypothetical protein
MCVVTVRFVDIGGIVYHRCVKHNFIGYMHVIFNDNKPAQILFQSTRPHTITKMDDNINMAIQ